MTGVGAGVYSAVLLWLGYQAFGAWTSLIFSFGFAGGFVLWLVLPSTSDFAQIRAPFWLAFASFIFLHRVEENLMKFQQRLAELTGTPTPELTSPSLILLVILSVGGWLAVPVLMKKGFRFGPYLAWTFFASMGVTELAHFVFPIFTAGSYSYFPGMASVLVLAPIAWWGMIRLGSKDASGGQ